MVPSNDYSLKVRSESTGKHLILFANIDHFRLQKVLPDGRKVWIDIPYDIAEVLGKELAYPIIQPRRSGAGLF